MKDTRLTCRFGFVLVLLAVWLAFANLAIAQVPTLITRPTNQVVAVGGTLVLNATAGGGTPLAYQWFKDSRRLLGATSSTFTVANAGITNSGTYYAVVTNTSGIIISLPALVSVDNPSLLAWGNDSEGQIGAGNSAAPIDGSPAVVMSNVVTGAAAYQHSLFVTTNGDLWALGWNYFGQLGDGTADSLLHETPIHIATNVVAAAGGYEHSLFVTTNGVLWAMGYNGYGQLGNGTMTQADSPVSVASNVVAVAAGQYHSLFLKADGTLWAMGYNGYGQLGNGAVTNVNQPVKVAGNVVAVAAGANHSLFVAMDGTLWAMGLNSSGQLGTSANLNDYTTPINVAGGVVSVAAGQNHSLFVKTNGTLWVTGNNQYGQLGNGTINNAFGPISVASNVVAVAAGMGHSLFTMADGTLWAMGYNADGQLGNGTTTDVHTPVSLPHMPVAGIFPASTANHSLAVGVIQAPATVTLGNLSQIATGGAISVSVNTTPPGLVVSLTYNGSTVAPASAGSYTVIGTVNNPNYYGGVTNTLVITGLVVEPTNLVVAVGGMVTLSVTAGGATQPYQWFKDGRLLLGATNGTLTVTNAGLTDAGAYYVVVTNGGGMVISLPVPVAVGNPSLLAWGWNDIGQLGNGTYTDVHSPVIVASNVLTVAGGDVHSLFTKTDGTLWAMGYNDYGQLGIATNYPATNRPVNIASHVVGMAAGFYHSLFLESDGTLWAMGMNYYGQLGTGATTAFTTPNPTPVNVASGVVAVAAGYAHSLFVMTDGTLWAMGYNNEGQLGAGTNNNNPNPTPLEVASNVVAVAAGQYHSLFMKTDRTLWAMGGQRLWPVG